MLTYRLLADSANVVLPNKKIAATYSQTYCTQNYTQNFIKFGRAVSEEFGNKHMRFLYIRDEAM